MTTNRYYQIRFRNPEIDPSYTPAIIYLPDKFPSVQTALAAAQRFASAGLKDGRTQAEIVTVTEAVDILDLGPAHE